MPSQIFAMPSLPLMRISRASSGLATEFHEQIASASRALDIARQIRDNDRSEAAIVMLLQLHDKAVAGEGWWWKTYDRLSADKALTDERRAYLAQSLEGLAADYADTANPEKFDPFQLESVSERLQAYYNRVGSRPDLVRLQETVGRAFEHAAGLGDNLRASSMLQRAEMLISMPASQRMRSERGSRG